MQISAISSANSFGRGYGISDEDAQRIALSAALEKADKRRSKTKLAYASIPVIAGLTAAALTRGKMGTVITEANERLIKRMPPVSEFLGRTVEGKAAKVSEGLKSAGNWLGLMGTAVVGGLGLKAIADKSDGYRNFRVNHPALTFLGDMALFTAAIIALPMGGRKLYSKLSPEFKAGVAKNVGNVAERINKLEAPKFVKNGIDAVAKYIPESIKGIPNLIAEHTPAAIKDFGKGILRYAPEITLFTTFFSSLSEPSRIKSDFAKEYNKIKNA